MPTRYQKWIVRQDLRNHPDWWYLFGDNELRVGFGGQAREMRGERNSIGVTTLRAPGQFWSDVDWKRQCLVIDKDLEPVLSHLFKGEIVIIPSDGLGTGLAQLASKSPLTFAHLQDRLEELKSIP